MNVAAFAPETEAPVDPAALESLIGNSATRTPLDAYDAIRNHAFVELYQLIPLGAYEHPFILRANDYDTDDTWAAFATYNAAETAYAWWVDELKRRHGECECDYPCDCGWED
jgi:hypothetical protein